MDAVISRNLRGAAAYFLWVFGTGFVLGTIRVLWVVPRLGERYAELLETPLMLVATVLAARHVVRRHRIPPRTPAALAVGLMALALMLLAEIGVVLWVARETLADYIAHRDPVSGAAYLAMLGIFAVMPWLAVRTD